MLSCHKDGENVIDGGKFDGKTLSEVIKETGKDILGTKAQKYDFFPILIKLIDAKPPPCFGQRSVFDTVSN